MNHAQTAGPRATARSRAAFTMTELLVVLVVMSLMASLAVPVYVNKAEKAKISVAQQDVHQLAEAEEACASLHGFYVPLQVLNDVPAATGLDPNTDSIDRENNIYLIDPSVPLAQFKFDNQPRLTGGTTSTDARVRTLLTHWEGPFINFQRFYKGNSSQIGTANTYQMQDYPLDPWGNPYRFFSPVGIIGAGADTNLGSSTLGTNFSDGLLMTTYHLFDRFAIVSFGPDGTLDKTGTKNGDDIIYTFGMLPGGNLNNETNF